MENNFKDDIEIIFDSIKLASVEIFDLLKNSMGEYTSTQNSTGDTQLQVDVLSDEVIIKHFKNLSIVKQICSEEQESAINISQNGKYSIAYDPLDGSSLMGANLSVGSIFGIYNGDFLPENIVASAYVVYGMVIGIGFASNACDGVSYHVYNGKEFVYKKTLSLNNSGKINATGGTQKNWSTSHKEKIESLFNRGYRLRYSGGMVPDLHHILVKGGGLFSYPATSDAPNGKLRMLFEVFPFAYIFNKAGGDSTNGKDSILSLKPKHLHDTTPCFFGSKEEIEFVREK